MVDMSVGVSRERPGTTAANVTIGLAALGALANLVGALVVGVGVLRHAARYDNSLAGITVLGGLLLTFALGYGALLVYRRDESGRFAILLAAGVWTAAGAVGLFGALIGYESDYGVRWPESGGAAADIATSTTGLPGAITALVHSDVPPNLTGLLLPVLILVAAGIHATALWFEDDPAMAARRRALAAQYSPDQPRPSGGTAIAAGVLAVLGCLANALVGAGFLILALAGADGIRSRSTYIVDSDVYQLVFSACSVLVAMVLGVGGAFVLMRRKVGRVLVILGCVGALLPSLVTTVIDVIQRGELGSISAATALAALLFALGFPVLTLYLAAHRNTRRWLTAPAQPSAADLSPKRT